MARKPVAHISTTGEMDTHPTAERKVEQERDIEVEVIRGGLGDDIVAVLQMRYVVHMVVLLNQHHIGADANPLPWIVRGTDAEGRTGSKLVVLHVGHIRHINLVVVATIATQHAERPVGGMGCRDDGRGTVTGHLSIRLK